MPPIVRPAAASDYDGILKCLERNEMSTWTREHWNSIWDDYPYRAEFHGVPRGFVLEADGLIVGTISGIWSKYILGDRELRSVTAASMAVDPAHRAGSVRLFGEQLLRHGVDLYFNGSASATASQIMDTLKVMRVPQPDNDLTLLWAVNGRRVAAAGLRRRGTPLAAVLAPPLGAGLRIASRFAARRASRVRYPVVRADVFSNEFDALWAAIQKHTTKLIAFRDSATLTWRYARGMASGQTVVLTVRRGGELAAYAVLVRTPRPRLGIVAFTIHDMQCIDDDAGLVVSLVQGALRETKSASLDLLEWSGFTGKKRAIAERSSILRHRGDVWQAFYHCREPALKAALASPERWDFSPYDSD